MYTYDINPISIWQTDVGRFKRIKERGNEGESNDCMLANKLYTNKNNNLDL